MRSAQFHVSVAADGDGAPPLDDSFPMALHRQGKLASGGVSIRASSLCVSVVHL
jgi:hypothetical protein